MARPARLLIAVGLAVSAIAALTVPHDAVAQHTSVWSCTDGLVAVKATSESAAETVCEQAAKAREFLGTCGITGRSELMVHVTPFMARTRGRRVGDYNPAQARIRLLPYSSFVRISKPTLGLTPVLSRILHASVAAHEIAHGIFHDHIGQRVLTDNAHEYVAYVVQLSTLPEAVQKNLREENAGPPVTNLFMFSFFLLMADPERFGLAAWRHFHQPENGCAFLHRVAAGAVHFPPPGD
ncbi:MAG: DUF6639 family protein [Hyphomicrobium sp.]